MADYTQTVGMPDHKRGDRWRGISEIGPIVIDGATPTDALIRVRMMFRRRRASRIYTGEAFTIDSQADPAPDALAVVDDAATWLASIPVVQDFLPEAGTWDWDMEFWDAANTSPITLFKGTILVHNDVTR